MISESVVWFAVILQFDAPDLRALWMNGNSQYGMSRAGVVSDCNRAKTKVHYLMLM